MWRVLSELFSFVACCSSDNQRFADSHLTFTSLIFKIEQVFYALVRVT